MILNLVPTKRSCHKYTQVKYEGRNFYKSKDTANVKVFAKNIQKKKKGPMDKPKACPDLSMSGHKKRSTSGFLWLHNGGGI